MVEQPFPKLVSKQSPEEELGASTGSGAETTFDLEYSATEISHSLFLTDTISSSL